MNKIVGIGANVCDTLINAPHYPTEDTKIKANGIIQCGGGPCATGLAAASRLGESCAFIGTLTDDSAGKFLKGDLEKYGISTEYTTVKEGYRSFASYILLSEDSATRTCVFDRGSIPALRLSPSQMLAVSSAEILMVDGNELEAAIAAAELAAESGTRVLYDAGGLYPGVERLLPLADYLIPSEEFALAHTGKATAGEAARALFEAYSPEAVVITQGKLGGIVYDGKELMKYPAFTVKAVDTNGAGDVFHGAYAFAMTRKMSYYDAAVFSSAVSALKCTAYGARAAVPSYDETIRFLKENGYEF